MRSLCVDAGTSMLRITTDDQARVLTFRLEGRLEGPWVGELQQCWLSMVDAATRRAVSIDLTGVTYIDAAGKAQLAHMHGHGAQLIADDCMTKAVVEEIVEDEQRKRTRLHP
jgi:anti-anti-sigma regulatory factor